MEGSQSAVKIAGEKSVAFFQDTENANMITGKKDILAQNKITETLVSNLNDAAQAQAEDVASKTLTKEQAHNELVAVMTKTTDRAKVSAKQAGNSILAKSLTKPKNFFKKPDGGETAVVTNCQSIITIIQNNLSVFNNVDAKDVDAMNNALKAFIKLKDTPTIAIKVKKVKGTDKIATITKSLNESLNDTHGLINDYFEDTDFANTYNAIVEVANIGIRHNILEVTPIDEITNQVLPGGSLYFTDDPKKTIYKALKNNIIRAAKIRSGKRPAVISIPNRPDVSITVNIKARKTNKVTVPFK